MGNDIYSSANLMIDEKRATADILATVVDRLRAIPEIGDEVEAAGAPLEVIAFMVAEALGISRDEYSTEVVRAGDQFMVTTCGWGRSRAVDQTLMILADAGFSGTVTCEDELYERWRHRIDAAGDLHRDEGTTVYSGGPITGVWIVQMQSTDESDSDHVAVVGSEPDAEAILADWARTEARTLIAAGALDPARIDFDVEASMFLERWADVGGVKWDVYQAQ